MSLPTLSLVLTHPDLAAPRALTFDCSELPLDGSSVSREVCRFLEWYDIIARGDEPDPALTLDLLFLIHRDLMAIFERMARNGCGSEEDRRQMALHFEVWGTLAQRFQPAQVADRIADGYAGMSARRLERL